MRPTLFTANWTDLAAFNYTISPSILRPYIPSDIQLDSFNDETYLSVIALRFGDCSLLGTVPLFLQPTFPMIAFRIYVKRTDSEGNTRRGTMFLKEIVPHPSFKMTARFLGKRTVHRAPVTSNISRGSSYLFWWGRIADNNWLEATVEGEAFETKPDTLEDFIFEKEWDFVPFKGRHALQYQAVHPRWKTWNARNFEAHINLRGVLPNEIAKAVSKTPASVIIAEGSRVRVGFPSFAKSQRRIAPATQLHRLN